MCQNVLINIELCLLLFSFKIMCLIYKEEIAWLKRIYISNDMEFWICFTLSNPIHNENGSILLMWNMGYTISAVSCVACCHLYKWLRYVLVEHQYPGDQLWSASRILMLTVMVTWAPRIILSMGSANERRCHIVTLSLIGWAHTQNDPGLLSEIVTWVINQQNGPVFYPSFTMTWVMKTILWIKPLK